MRGLCRAQETTLQAASAVAYDAEGDLFLADGSGHRVWKATLAGTLVPVAGTGVQGFAGDGGQATAAELNGPLGLAVAVDGSLWIADTGNHRLRRVDGNGVIQTVAGTGIAGFSGDGGVALTARLRRPTALSSEASGGMLVCDTGNERVRRIVNGTISTVAGSGTQGNDGGAVVAASVARLDEPLGVASTASGDVLVADSHNDRILRVDAAGMVHPFAGSGLPGSGGDGMPGLSAELFHPQGLAVLGDGGVLVADTGNERLREIDAGGVMRTVAGSGVEGASADGGAAGTALLRSPRAAAVSSFGLPAVADTRGRAVRVVAGDQNLYLPAALAAGRVTALQATAGESLTYGASAFDVSVSGSAAMAQGTVQVEDAGVAQGSAALQGATAQIAASSLSAGSHTLQVSYAGDGLNPATVTSLAADVQPRSVTAMAASAAMEYGTVVPSLTGTVAGVLPQDVNRVQAAFIARSDADPAPPGVYAIRAAMTGSAAGNYTVVMAPTSGTLTVTRARSSLTSTGAAGYAGLQVALGASVQAVAQGVPGGSVLFTEGGEVIASAPVVQGAASTSWTTGSVGVHQIIASYAGDSNFLPSAPVITTVTIAALPDFQMAAASEAAVSVDAGSVAQVPFTVASLGGDFTGAVSFSATGLPGGAAVSFSPPQVIPGSAVAAVTMRVETLAVSTAAGQAVSRTGMQLAGLLVCGTFFLRRRRMGALLVLLILPGLSGCGARSLGTALGAESKTYTVQITGTGTNLAGKSVVRSIPVSLTIRS